MTGPGVSRGDLVTVTLPDGTILRGIALNGAHPDGGTVHVLPDPENEDPPWEVDVPEDDGR